MTGRDDPLRQIDDFFGTRPPARLGVAVSGGSDSLGLLLLLKDWGRAALHAVTVDHRLRPASASEALHVARICGTIGVPHRALEWQGWDGRGNLQDQARRGRYAMLAEWAGTEALDAVALGHTRNDQAETVLMRLARSAGVDGLAGMAPWIERHGARFCRPLLGAARGDLRHALDGRGIRWIEDPTNEDESFERVRARQALAPLADLGITVAALADVAANLREARDALAEAAADFAGAHARVVAGDVLFDRARLNGLPAALRRRLLSGALSWVSASGYPPRREALGDALDACREARNVTLHGCHILVSGMGVRVVREAAAVEALAAPTDGLWDGRWRFEGPHEEGLSVRALGEAVRACPGWRETGLPRAALLASPAIWRESDLVAAPVAGFSNGWTAKAPDCGHFRAALLAH